MSPEIKDLVLKHGSHKNAEEGFCVMEAVAFVAGEPFSDHPKCASKVIAAFLRSWNDSLPTDEDRTRLLGPLIPRLVGTAGSDEVEIKRAWIMADWTIRTAVPMIWEVMPELKEQAEALRGLEEIKDKASWEKAEPIVDKARALARALDLALDLDLDRDLALARALALALARALDLARALARALDLKKRLQESTLEMVGRMIECKS